jgi:hypothetical protein
MKIHWTLLLLIIFFSCEQEEKKIDYTLYSRMDKVEVTENKLRLRKKAAIPFTFNQIYDPFIKIKKGRNKKSVFEKGAWKHLKVSVLDSALTNINVTNRKGKIEKFTQGFPVIIENISKKETMFLPLHRGCAKIIQEAFNNKNEWVEVESYTKEKVGDFYYQISPFQYVFTKVPVYYGDDSTIFRVALIMDDTTIYSNEYRSTIQQWMLR